MYLLEKVNRKSRSAALIRRSPSVSIEAKKSTAACSSAPSQATAAYGNSARSSKASGVLRTNVRVDNLRGKVLATLRDIPHDAPLGGEQFVQLHDLTREFRLLGSDDLAHPQQLVPMRRMQRVCIVQMEVQMRSVEIEVGETASCVEPGCLHVAVSCLRRGRTLFDQGLRSDDLLSHTRSRGGTV